MARRVQVQVVESEEDTRILTPHLLHVLETPHSVVEFGRAVIDRLKHCEEGKRLLKVLFLERLSPRASQNYFNEKMTYLKEQRLVMMISMDEIPRRWIRTRRATDYVKSLEIVPVSANAPRPPTRVAPVGTPRGALRRHHSEPVTTAAAAAATGPCAYNLTGYRVLIDPFYPTLNIVLAGLDAFLWHGQELLHASLPLVADQPVVLVDLDHAHRDSEHPSLTLATHPGPVYGFMKTSPSHLPYYEWYPNMQIYQDECPAHLLLLFFATSIAACYARGTDFLILANGEEANALKYFTLKAYEHTVSKCNCMDELIKIIR